MTNDPSGLSRRKVLGAMATVGTASALGGAGTWSFFSDDENFANNRLVAGELDLKMDWQEHYSVWSEEEAKYAAMASDENSDYFLPGGGVGDDIELVFKEVDGDDAGSEPSKAEGKAGFLRATSIEAYPDTDNDGIQDDFASVPGETTEQGVGYICEDGADTSRDLDPAGGKQLRTDNDDTQGGAPLINLNDVKPGDFGEVTFSLHLCDNPGYVWMFADNVTASENGVNEPESKDEDEDQIQGSGDPPLKDPDNDGEKTVELLDKIQVRAWYDINGDNLKDDTEPMVVGPDSLRNVLSTLTGRPGVKLHAYQFAGIPTIEDQNGSTGSIEIANSSSFNCNASSDLGTPSNPDCSQFGYDIGYRFDASELPSSTGLFTDFESPVFTADDGNDYQIRLDLEVVEVEYDENLDRNVPVSIRFSDLEIQTVTGGTGNGYVEAGTGLLIVKGGARANLCTPDEPASGGGSHVFESPVNQGGNVPAISHLDICIAEIEDDGNGDVPSLGDPSECLQNSTTYHIGFEWWLPLNHGNEVQSDSVTFNLGFYTEQCRHNDGSGQFGNV